MVFQGLIVNVKFTVKLRKSEYLKKNSIYKLIIYILKQVPRSLGVGQTFSRVRNSKLGEARVTCVVPFCFC